MIGAAVRATTFLNALRRHPSREPLRGLPLRSRVLATTAIAAGGLIHSAFGERPAQDVRGADALVSIGGMGDHIRMLNAFSRMRERPAVTVYTNDNGAGLDGLFEGVVVRSTGGRHGASFLGPSLVARALRREPSFARGLVVQPMETQPIAIAFAAAVARNVFVNGDGPVPVARRRSFDTSSWQRAYESFFAWCYPGASFGDRPNIVERYRWVGGSRIVAIHPGGIRHVRGLAASAFVDAAALLVASGFTVAIVGSSDEGPDLLRTFQSVPCLYWVGLDLPTIAANLTGVAALIAIDSSMMNLADAVGVPSVVVYNLTRPETHGPFTTRLVPLVCEGAHSLGAVYDVRWDVNGGGRGRPPTAESIATAVRSMTDLKASSC